MYNYLALLVVLVQFTDTALGQCEPYRFASYYHDSMVLQKEGARVWGYVDLPGMIVQLTIDDLAFYEIISFAGPGPGQAMWEVTLDPVEPGGPYTMWYRSSMCVEYIFDVYFGDVWFCSGQSNMEFGLDYIFGGEEELEDVVNYPLIRTFHANHSYDDSVHHEPPSIHRNWAVADSENVADFSGLCWVFGRHLFDELQYPIGLIQSTWGGTIIESWSSPDANAQCFEDEIPSDEPPNGNSQLWNAMVHPYTRMSIYGYLYYQAENNYGRHDDFACSHPALINDYREKWFEATDGATDPMFPFGFVQLAPLVDVDKDTGFPNMRWAQTVNHGVVPNDDLVNVFMATAVDLPDWEAPEGPWHPRHKKQISYRLSLGAFSMAYDIDTHGRFQGPYPTSIDLGDSEMVLEYDNGEAELDIRTTSGFELCCSPDTDTLCNPRLVNNTDPQQWTDAPVSDQGTSDVTLDVPCDEDQYVTGIRYIWRESPCPLEECAVYSVDNEVPAPPFIYEGHIEPSK